jgi:hypothetical protein
MVALCIQTVLSEDKACVDGFEINYMLLFAYNGTYPILGVPSQAGAHPGGTLPPIHAPTLCAACDVSATFRAQHVGLARKHVVTKTALCAADWEHLTVRVTATGELEGLWYNAHRNRDGTWQPCDAVPTTPCGRPIVYVALHGHGVYPTVSPAGSGVSSTTAGAQHGPAVWMPLGRSLRSCLKVPTPMCWHKALHQYFSGNACTEKCAGACAFLRHCSAPRMEQLLVRTI